LAAELNLGLLVNTGAGNTDLLVRVDSGNTDVLMRFLRSIPSTCIRV
jgi:hypothetical protein